MQEVYDFLKDKCQSLYFIASIDGDQARLSRFGTIDIFDGQLTIQTGKGKDCYKQFKENPKVEICGCAGPEWVRVACTLVEVDTVEAKKHMLDAYESLRAIYDENDDITAIFAITEATATFASFTAEPHTVTF